MPYSTGHILNIMAVLKRIFGKLFASRKFALFDASKQITLNTLNWKIFYIRLYRLIKLEAIGCFIYLVLKVQ